MSAATPQPRRLVAMVTRRVSFGSDPCGSGRRRRRASAVGRWRRMFVCLPVTACTEPFSREASSSCAATPGSQLAGMSLLSHCRVKQCLGRRGCTSRRSVPRGKKTGIRAAGMLVSVPTGRASHHCGRRAPAGTRAGLTQWCDQRTAPARTRQRRSLRRPRPQSSAFDQATLR
jgi:hypothetical protein